MTDISDIIAADARRLVRGSLPDPDPVADDVHTPPVITGIKPSIQHGEHEVEVKGVPLIGQPLALGDSLDPLLEYFGLDPAMFEVVGNTFSSWQQSCNVDGERDMVWMYAAKFRKITPSEDPALHPAVLHVWREHHINDSLDLKPLPQPTGATYKIKIADPQLGKEGTASAIGNWKRGVERHLTQALWLRDNGVDITNLHLAWLGDEIEGVCNNYAGQSHTIELNLSDQIATDFDLRCWTIDQAASLGLNLSCSSVISNHGEATRQGGKDVVTTIGDNFSTLVARLVRDHFDAMAKHTGLTIPWTIGMDETPGILYKLSGVWCYDTHGYIEKGKGASVEARMLSAIREQIAGQPKKFGKVQIVDSAHNHHDWKLTDGRFTVFGNPALEKEKSSAWFLNSRGKWSLAGMHGMVVSDQYARGYAHENIF